MKKTYSQKCRKKSTNLVRELLVKCNHKTLSFFVAFQYQFYFKLLVLQIFTKVFSLYVFFGRVECSFQRTGGNFFADVFSPVCKLTVTSINQVIFHWCSSPSLPLSFSECLFAKNEVPATNMRVRKPIHRVVRTSTLSLYGEKCAY